MVSKKYEFVCKDRYGVTVYCTVADWIHINKHQELIGKQELIKLVIEKPDSIYQDTDYKDRRVLYKACALPNPIGACYVRVVIKYSANPLRKRGWVCTAFASESKKKREVLIWEK